MKNFFRIIVIVLGFSSTVGLTTDKVIYGDDDRFDLINSPLSLYNDFARSTVAMVKKDRLFKKEHSIHFSIDKNVRTLKKKLNLCQEEKFSDQPHLSSCSGFLVGEDIILTAGHCAVGRMQSSCENYYWVFDYKVNDPNDPFSIIFPEENVYGCKKVLSAKFEPWTEEKNDFAIIQLDRKVVGRKPLALRKEGEVQEGESLVLIGNPWGLPTKVSLNAQVLKNDNKTWLMANLDSFEGNSGSAVFNELTGEVEGILVRGKPDTIGQYVPGVGFCKMLNYCHDDGTNCKTHDKIKGEHVTKVSVFLKELEKFLNPNS